MVTSPLLGRRGHARVVVLTIIEQELRAAKSEFGTSVNVPDSNSWVAPGVRVNGPIVRAPVVVTQAFDRTGAAAHQATSDLLEDWRPEVLIVCGIAAGLRRAEQHGEQRVLDGPVVGDVVVATYVHNAEYMKADGGQMHPRYLASAQPSSRLLNVHCRPLADPGDWMTEELVASRCDGSTAAVHFEELAGVDAVMGDPTNAHHQEIMAKFDKAAAADMESHGVAYAIESYDQGCHYRPRWLCIRSVSDEVAMGDDSNLLSAEAHEVRKQWREPAARTAAAFAHAVVKRLLAKPRRPVSGYAGAAAYRASVPGYSPPPFAPPINPVDSPERPVQGTTHAAGPASPPEVVVPEGDA
ncbi:hypothetical protein acdb102_15920 [Acidothermaceae bacterium B102]|nr:hypothetical protein acdb102_15920 [Acidothermaceae bacterium B102]